MKHKPNAVLFFVDMLGVRSLWHSGGWQGAEKAFSLFRNLILENIPKSCAPSIIDGHVESDAAAFQCRDIGAAAAIGRRLFQNAFRSARKSTDRRIWLRGAIVPSRDDIPLLTNMPPLKGLRNVLCSSYSPGLLNAIAMEKSGFKGMRILVAGGHGTGERSRFRQVNMAFADGTKHFCPFRRVSGLGYSRDLPKGYTDFLWMACEAEAEWEEMKGLMVKRLGWAAASPEEFQQAAATQAVFHRCGSLLRSVKESQQTKRKFHSILELSANKASGDDVQ